MEIREIQIIVQSFSGAEELGEEDARLVRAAREATAGAYAPYSGFKVGTALLLGNGEIVTGSNQENAVFPAGSCAERSALFWAQSNFPDQAVRTVAVTAVDRSGSRAVNSSPCGICRQALLENEFRFGKPIRILLDCRDRIDLLSGISALLPLSFGPGVLG